MTNEYEAALDFFEKMVSLYHIGETLHLDHPLVVIGKALKAGAEGRIVEWQPIETAPRDGTIVLIEDDFGHVQNYRWSETMGGSWQHVTDDDVYSNPRFMKRWAHLPPPPKKED